MSTNNLDINLKKNNLKILIFFSADLRDKNTCATYIE